MIRTVLFKHVGSNDSNKIFGPVCLLVSTISAWSKYKNHLLNEKGTYEYTANPTDLILEDVTRRLDCFGKESTTKRLAQTIMKWADDSLNRAWIAIFNVIRKLHKEANAQEVRSRPIFNNSGYPTGHISHFLHSQVTDAVNTHAYVLQDSLCLIRQQESLSFSQELNILLS